MTTHNTLVIPAEDLTRLVVVCSGCQARLEMDLQKWSGVVQLLRCAACQTEFSKDVDEAVNQFITFRQLTLRKKVQVELVLIKPERVDGG